METQPQQVTPILSTAWTRYAQFNDASLKRSKAYLKMRRWIIVTGILATMFAILVETYPANFPAWGSFILKVFLIVAPILGSILASVTSKKFSNGDWLISRAGAEEILKEIYMFRTILQNTPDRRAWLEKRMIEIQRQVYRGMGGEFILKPYKGKVPPYYYPDDPNSDPGLGDISGDEYFRYRLEDQLAWHIKKINQRETERTRLLWFIYIAAGASAFLVALDGAVEGPFSLWVAFTASLTAGFLAWQELRNMDEIIRNYSKVIMELTIVYDHWGNLEQEERTTVEFNKMVKATEDVLWAQNVEYIKSMQEALSDESLEREASLVNRVIKESVESSERFQKAIADAVVDQTQKSLAATEETLTETFKSALGSLAEEASSELVQAELADMQRAIRDAAKNIAERTGLSSSLKTIMEEFDGVEISGNTPVSVLNDLMSRLPKTTDAKG
ncbi:MAG: SLATT domain-containing protein [Anaerolineales bacterium]|nr:SLATT domain-containing protein [Anaerolineales bacterium]